MALSDIPHSPGMNGHSAPDRQHLPDPWLFDSEALLRELARCRETALQIPIKPERHTLRNPAHGERAVQS